MIQAYFRVLGCSAALTWTRLQIRALLALTGFLLAVDRLIGRWRSRPGRS